MQDTFVEKRSTGFDDIIQFKNVNALKQEVNIGEQGDANGDVFFLLSSKCLK